MSTFIRILSKNLINKNLISILNYNNCRNVSLTKYLFDETIIKMPALSPTMISGTIVKWHKNVGDKIMAGDILCEVQTDKAIVAYEYDDGGILAKILIDENSSTEIQVGDLIAIVCGEDDDWKNVKIPENIKTQAKTKETITTTEEIVDSDKSVKESTTATKPKQSIDLDKIKIGPSARNLINHYGIEMSTIEPTGNHGVIMKEDVLKVIQQNSLQPKHITTIEQKKDANVIQMQATTITTQPSFIDIELSNMRRTIAKRLTESKTTIPHAYMRVKCTMDEIIKLRKYFKQKSLPVSINDMIVKAVALALRQTPGMNCRWNQQQESIEIIDNIDVSIAVATSTGLITPIIKSANRLTLEEISNESKKLIQKAKDGKLQPDEFMGGTFSISNLGMYDIDHFVGVINPPQAAILAVGSTRQQIIGDDPNNYHTSNQSIMSLSFDQRAINEELAAYFLENLRDNLSNTELLMKSDGSKTNRRLLSFM